MKNVYIMSLFSIFMLLVGCYEDKGNYGYENINRITISPLTAEDGWSGTYGDTLQINPRLNFESGVDDDQHLTFQWDLNGVKKTGWDKRDFYWIADSVIVKDGYLTLTVTDTRTGVNYFANDPFYIRVAAEFDVYDGVAILSEVDGNSQISFISFGMKYDYAGKRIKVESAKIYKNIYEERQKEVLGQGPIRFHEHYVRDELGGSARNNQLLVLQNSGPVDVVSSTLIKDIDLNRAFVDGTYPPSTSFKEAAFMTYADVLLDQEGKLYSRIKPTSTLFHSSYFFQEPLKFEGKVLKNCHLIDGIYADNKFTLIHDKDNKRFLAILDGIASEFLNPNQESAGKIVKVPATPKDEDTPPGFIPLDNFGEYEYVGGGYDRPDGYQIIGYFIIFKNAAGEYFRQSFSLGRTGYYSSTLIITNATFAKITIDEVPDIIYPTQYFAADVFFVVGNKLYRFDRRNPNQNLTEYLTFESNIVCINTESGRNRWAIIALENGKVLILSIEDAKNLNPDEKIIYELPADVNFDRIVDARIVTGGNGW